MQGLWAPSVTPFDSDDNIDTDRLASHVAWLLEFGCHGVVLFGTTGEASSFTLSERKKALESLLSSGVDSGRLAVGTGCTAVRDTIDLTSHALGLGVNRVLVLPPFYLKPVTREGLIRSFAEVIDGVASDSLELFAYHFPRLSGVPISPSVLNDLHKRFGPTIAGVKDSTGDAGSLTAFLDECPQLDVFPGTETLLLAGLRRGSAGVITAGANVNPALLRQIYDAPEQADALQDKATAIRTEIQRHGNVHAIKALLAHYHHDPAWLRVRAPLSNSEFPEGSALAAGIGALGYEWPKTA